MSDSSVEIAELERAVRAHSASRAFESSVPLWNRLVTLAPENWGYALDLIHDLRAAGDSAEADDVHRRAVLRFPKEFWIVYHWALAAWNKQDYATAEQRSVPLLALLQQLPPDKRDDVGRHAYWLLGSLAMKRHAFKEAVSYFERACHQAPHDPNLADLLRRADHYDRVSASFGSPPLATGALHAAADYGVLVINLDRDTERFRRLCQRFQDSPVELVRVPGVYGSYLPGIALQSLCRTAGTPLAGTAGCLLTHVKAWETMVERGLDVCLILEDDAIPTVNLPHRFASLGIPSDFDLCFVNRKMEPVLDSEAALSLDQATVFDEAFTTSPPNTNAPGAYGYFLSAAGARKLLGYIARDGFAGDVDCRLVAYSVTKAAAARALPDARAILSHMDGRPEERLRAFTLFPCLIDVDTSYINARVTENLRGQEYVDTGEA